MTLSTVVFCGLPSTEVPDLRCTHDFGMPLDVSFACPHVSNADWVWAASAVRRSREELRNDVLCYVTMHGGVDASDVARRFGIQLAEAIEVTEDLLMQGWLSFDE